MIDEEENIIIDEFSYHEALDRSWVILNHLETTLGDHPVIQGEREAKELYEKALENLAALYQKLGELKSGE